MNPAFLPSRSVANLTIIQIMQQERSFLRRLCVLKIDIYEPKFNARRAYCSIPLAVKTSRPQVMLSLLTKTMPTNIRTNTNAIQSILGSQ